MLLVGLTGNIGSGINIVAASDNTIGGTSAEDRNVIAGNGRDGITLFDVANDNQILGNAIGTDVTGKLGLGNTGNGVSIFVSSANNTIGGDNAGAGNLILANGSSGHGVMHSPAIGRLVAELIAGAQTSIDITPLRPSRFVENDAISSPTLL